MARAEGPSTLETNNPPLNWFVGIGKKSEGITAVVTGDDFNALAKGRVADLFRLWKLYHGTSMYYEFQRARAQQVVSEADRVIPAVTGFTPEQIAEHISFLNRAYQRKTKAPFTVILL